MRRGGRLSGQGWADTHELWRRDQRKEAAHPRPPDANASLADDQRKVAKSVLSNGTVLTTYLDAPPEPAVPPSDVTLVGVVDSTFLGHRSSDQAVSLAPLADSGPDRWRDLDDGRP